MGRREAVCGLDVHRSVIVACLRRPRGKAEVQSFATTRAELSRMEAWLTKANCKAAGMEATGVFWRPVHRVLEGRMKVLVANPQHIKAIKGRKTDKADAAWIAQKVADGGISPSFVPPLDVRETRDLAQLRNNIIQARGQVRNEVHKLMAGAGVPLSSVLSDLFGTSGWAILQHLAKGKSAWDDLAGLVKGKLRKKLEAVRLALEMPLTEGQQWELAFQIQRLEHIEEELRRVEEALEERLRPHEEVRARLTTIPGIGREAAGLILAHLGPDVSAFPTSRHFSAWIGLCPGNDESGGKAHPARIRKGNRALKTLLVQCAHGTAKANGSWLQQKYRSLKGRMWSQKAIIAIAHKLAVILYHVLMDGTVYQDQGCGYEPGLRKARALRKAIRLIQAQGGTVTLPDLIPPRQDLKDTEGGRPEEGFTG